MTERLYYDDPDLTAFDARALACEARDGAWHVRLDRSAFYPTSGGQPFDTGTIGGARVTDVYQDEAHEIWHVCDARVAVGGEVRCRIDWARRFDHMQQHAADHMIAGQLHRLTGGYTVGLHLGQQVSTIDVILPDGATRLGGEMTQRIENLVNRDIQRDLPIRCFFPSEEEMKSLPLRKDPTVTEHIRVVRIGEEECVACGGTHPRSAGQIGLVKILGTAPARGKMRLTFVAGMRALSDYQARFAATEQAAALLSCQTDQLPGLVQASLERCRQLEGELGALKRAQALAQIEQMLASAQTLGGWRVVCREMDMDVPTLKELAKALIERERVIALLAAPQGGGQALLFARAGGDGPDMGKLLGEVARALGGKGGGRPDFAQGAAPSLGALALATQKMAETLQTRPQS